MILASWLHWEWSRSMAIVLLPCHKGMCSHPWFTFKHWNITNLIYIYIYIWEINIPLLTPCSSVIGWSSLVKFFCNENQLSSLPEGIGSGWKSIEKLYLNQNKLDSFPLEVNGHLLSLSLSLSLCVCVCVDIKEALNLWWWVWWCSLTHSLTLLPGFH